MSSRDPYFQFTWDSTVPGEEELGMDDDTLGIRTRKIMTKNMSQTLPSSSGGKDEEKHENGTTRSEEEDIPKRARGRNIKHVSVVKLVKLPRTPNVVDILKKCIEQRWLSDDVSMEDGRQTTCRGQKKKKRRSTAS
ncbi:hypothetical protein ACLB2K_004527 [Fragaria x ananassa]